MAFDVVHVIDPVEPTDKLDGMMWTNPDEMEGDVTVTRVWDADNGQWLKIGGDGPAGPVGPTGPAGADGAAATATHAADWDAHWSPKFQSNEEDNPPSPGVSPDWEEVSGVRLPWSLPAGWGSALVMLHGGYENEFAGRSLSMRILDPGGGSSPLVTVTDTTLAFGRTYIDWQKVVTVAGGFFALEVRSQDNCGAGNWASLTAAIFRMS